MAEPIQTSAIMINRSLTRAASTEPGRGDASHDSDLFPAKFGCTHIYFQQALTSLKSRSKGRFVVIRR